MNSIRPAKMTEQFVNQNRWRKENPVKRSIIMAFAKARIRAEKRGVPFNIPKGTTKSLFDRCGGRCELSGVLFRVSTTGICSIFSPSLDRINPSRGYVIGNIRLILNGLNALKGEGTDEELRGICKAVVKNTATANKSELLLMTEDQ